MTDTTSQQALSTLAVVGLGYVGLPTAVAEGDLTVNALDVDENRVQAIREGRTPRGHAALAPSRGFPGSFR